MYPIQNSQQDLENNNQLNTAQSTVSDNLTLRMKNNRRALTYILIPVILFLLSSVLPLAGFITFALSPVLIGMLIFGIYLLMKKPKSVPSQVSTKELPTYKKAFIALLIGVTLSGTAYFSSANLNGSEASIVYAPMMFIGFISLVSSLIWFIGTYFQRIKYSRSLNN